MTHEAIETTIREYIQQVIHLSLATSSGDRPWVSEVHFAYDDALNLYFISELGRRHSHEIASNPNVAGNIITQHHKHQKVRGVYFEGSAARIENLHEDHAGYKAYLERFADREAVLREIIAGEQIALYKIGVANYYLFDTYEPNRDKLQLPWKGGAK